MPPLRTALVGRCGSFAYLRRDATALGLLLLSMLDITSSFHKDGDQLYVPLNEYQQYVIVQN